MARTFAGGSDRINCANTTPASSQTVALRIKTSQATANTILAARWTSGSRSGWSLIMNNTANKVTINAWNASFQRVNYPGTTTVNDGNWHTLVAMFSVGTNDPNYLYVDGVLDASGITSGTAWAIGLDLNLSWGNIGFWAPYVGEMADVGVWTNVHLTADEIAAYHKGFSPKNLRPDALEIYMPLVRDPADRCGAPTNLFGATSVSDHPRVIGSLV